MYALQLVLIEYVLGFFYALMFFFNQYLFFGRPYRFPGVIHSAITEVPTQSILEVPTL